MRRYVPTAIALAVFVTMMVFSAASGKAAGTERLHVTGPEEGRLKITVENVKRNAQPLVSLGGFSAKVVDGSLKYPADSSETSCCFEVEVPEGVKPGMASLKVTLDKEVIQPEPGIFIPDPLCEAGKQPEILEVIPAGSLPTGTVKIIGNNLGTDITRVWVVVGETSVGIGPTSISKPDPKNGDRQELLFSLPAAGDTRYKAILGGKSLYNRAVLTVQVNKRAGNWEHLNVIHPLALWKVAGISAAMVMFLMTPLISVVCFPLGIASILGLGGILAFWLTSSGLWIITVVFVAASLGLSFWANKNRDTLKPLAKTLFLDKETNTYSLSRFQAFTWTVVLIGSYLYFALGRGLLIGKAQMPDLSPSLLGLLSISYGGLLVSRGIGAKVPKNELISTPPQLSNLITEGGAVSITRMQLLGFTFAGVAVFLYYLSGMEVFTSGLPEIPATLNGLLAISQGGYLGGKLTGDIAVNYILPSRVLKGKAATLKIFGAGFKDKTKVLVQGSQTPIDAKFMTPSSVEVELPTDLGETGRKQIVFIPPTGSSTLFDGAFELIDPKVTAAKKLGEGKVAVTVEGIEIAEKELKASIDAKPLKTIKKMGDTFTLETDAPVAIGATVKIETEDGVSLEAKVTGTV